MCGFLNIINFKSNENNYESIFKEFKKINQRGPDNTKKVKIKNYTAMFHRLSIIDLKMRSNQPMFSSCKRYLLTFNGEIYNFIELRKYLQNKGLKFNTKSDSEVVLNGFKKEGAKFVKKLRGMYAFTIWDNKEKKLYAFRDRLGQKPLYYHKSENQIIIASEIKYIKLVINKLKINYKTVYDFIVDANLDKNNNTFFKEIFKVPAANYFVIKNSRISKKKYWFLKLSEKKHFNLDDFKEKFEHNLKIHLRSDVPISFTCSGGMDSTSLLITSKKICKKNFFSISYLNNLDEIKVLDNLKKKYTLNHNFIKFGKFSENKFNDMLHHHDEPFHSLAIYYHYLARKFLRKKGYKILINGEGADEVLGGYNSSLYPHLCRIKNLSKLDLNKMINFYNLDKKICQKILDEKKYAYERIKLNFSNILNQKYLKQRKNSFKKKIIYFDSLKKFLKYKILNLDLPYILRFEDINSMANSIESRTPFVDHKLIEYVFSIKTKYFLKKNTTKYMLKNYWLKHIDGNYSKKKYQRPSAHNQEFIRYMKKTLVKFKNSEDKLINIKSVLDLIKNNKINFNLLFRIFIYYKWKDKNDF
jgi:asparagine synthase (glutamine-hydrolysing)